MCLRQLESPTPIKILLRMYVRPIGPGSNMVHVAGTVHVRTEELEVGGDWAPLHYEYTSFNQEGRVEIIDQEDCSELETTTNATTTTTKLYNKAPQHQTVPNAITVPPETGAAFPSTPVASIMPDSGDTTSWVWVMGAAGSVPILIILVILLVLLVVVVVSVSVILWRRRKATNNISKNKDPFAACHDPLMPQPQTADQFSTNSTNVSPLYRSPPPPPPPNYYSE
ncbi:hypothetical protein E2C01_032020 [Portunus trituberculatus]|uniref:Uncharacterized protein n=1 Tax=Portunus trituberculatus TaxID=210409 RepID=A0A5B7EWC1_PORTR|nr:hypothetical protein [Portunus trituberculatus]